MTTTDAISDPAALRIYRDVWYAYESMVENSRFNQIARDFCQDVDTIVAKLCTQDLLTYSRYLSPNHPHVKSSQSSIHEARLTSVKITLGRLAASAGLWPPEDYLTQGRPRTKL